MLMNEIGLFFFSFLIESLSDLSFKNKLTSWNRLSILYFMFSIRIYIKLIFSLNT